MLRRFDKVKFIIAGRGPREHELKERCYQLGIFQRVYFTVILTTLPECPYRGLMSPSFPACRALRNCGVEAMAARVPVVVSIWWISEIVLHGVMA